MKPAELFPGAVVMKDGVPIELSAVSNLWITVGPGTMTLAHHIDEFMPLPISPAVLRGLGLQYVDSSMVFVGCGISVHRAGNIYEIYGEEPVTRAHQMQALALHLYGVDLTWNQGEYDKAMKEDAK